MKHVPGVYFSYSKVKFTTAAAIRSINIVMFSLSICEHSKNLQTRDCRFLLHVHKTDKHLLLKQLNFLVVISSKNITSICSSLSSCCYKHRAGPIDRLLEDLPLLLSIDMRAVKV